MQWYVDVLIALAIVLVVGLGLVAAGVGRRGRAVEREPEAPTRTAPTAPSVEVAPPIEGQEPAEPQIPVVVEPSAAEIPEPTAGRLVRLRARLSRSQNALGRGLLAVLSRDRLDDDAWEELEDNLITADVGVGPTRQIVDRLRERTRVLGTSSAGELRTLLKEELVAALDPKLDRTAKGGIVIAVQRDLGIPVKLVGLGEGPDDLAPFEPEAFVEALLGN